MSSNYAGDGRYDHHSYPIIRQLGLNACINWFNMQDDNETGRAKSNQQGLNTVGKELSLEQV